MEISKFKLVCKWIFGGVDSVVDYLLDVLNKALEKIDPEKKETVQAVLNIALKVSNTLQKIAWAVPTKWQTAYRDTCDVLETFCTVLMDIKVSRDELDAVINSVKKAIEAWKSADDATCVTLEDCMVED